MSKKVFKKVSIISIISVIVIAVSMLIYSNMFGGIKVSGVVVECNDGSKFIIDENGAPIILESKLGLNELSTGDEVSITCESLQESNPAKAVVKKFNIVSIQSLHEHSMAPSLKKGLETLSDLGYEFK